jgi:cellulose synthase/poly-beta-1,6-N-acetylglucosamine synthase-like glycosyltransferase
MTDVLLILLVTPAALLCALTGFFLAQMLLSGRSATSPINAEPPPFVAIVPAHDEASVIADTLRSLRLAMRPEDHALIVADNCTDATAAIAREMGFEAVERCDAERRGKGFALEFGLAAIPGAMRDRPVVFVDADCTVEPHALRRLVAALAETGRPVQGRYLLTASPDGSRRSRLNAFAIRIKNHARQLGGQRMGVPGLMTGSGLALAPAHLANIRIGSPEIVEDLVLGLDLCRLGQLPLYCPDAVILSPLPADTEAELRQRARWEQGSMSSAVRHVPRLIGAALRRRSWPILARAVDLMIPPLSLLGGAVLLTLGFEAIVAAASGVMTGLWLALVALALLSAAIGFAWLRHGRDLLSLADLAALPTIAAGKLSNLAAALTGRKIDWMRTSRH